MRYWKILSGLSVLLSTMPAYASEFYADVLMEEGTHLTPVASDTLSSYRGGFRLKNDYVINIGLSITTSINGMTLFNTRIAHLMIQNGNLKRVPTPKTPDSRVEGSDVSSGGVVNVVQVGEGNSVEEAPVVPVVESITNPAMPIDSGTGNTTPTVVDTSTITNIIQNTLDNSVLGLNTVVDIDAQVGDVIKQIQVNQKLDDAILSSFY